MILQTQGECYCFKLLGSTLVTFPIAGEDTLKKSLKRKSLFQYEGFNIPQWGRCGGWFFLSSKPMSLTCPFVPAQGDSVVLDKNGTEGTMGCTENGQTVVAPLPNAIMSTAQGKEQKSCFYTCAHAGVIIYISHLQAIDI